MSILNSSRYPNDESILLQKAIQSLRLETQETLAASRDEIARLEEENEIKQMRIEEIDAELNDLHIEKEFGDAGSSASMHSSDKRGRARRRWSLASIGKNFRNLGDTVNENNDVPQRRSKSFDIDMELESEEEDQPREPRRRMTRKSSLLHPLPKRNSESKQEAEQLLMERLHEIQEDNKRMIQQHENNLKFKEEQVLALQLACEEQDHIIESLEEEIFRARQLGTDETLDRANESDMEDMRRHLLSLNGKEVEISSQIRLIKRIKGIKPEMRKSSISLLKKDIVESSIRLKSLKSMYLVQEAALREDLSIKETAWALSSTEVHLTELVSQHELLQLEKKASNAESSELCGSVDLATRTLQGELSIRECSDEIARKVLQLETLNLEKLIVAMLHCCNAFAEGVLQLKSKMISRRIGALISDITRQMENGIANAENTVSMALCVLEDTSNAYERDDSLLPEVVQSAYFASVHSDDSVTDSENDSERSESLANHPDLTYVIDENDRLDKQLREARETLEAKQSHTNSIADSNSRVKELESIYSQLCKKWDAKDEEFELAMKHAEEAKVEEDRLRAFLERTVRARLPS